MEMEKTGKLIAEVRREKGMTQKELAAQLHVSDRAVSKWERGAGFPDVALLEGLAEALDLTVTDLLRGERQPVPAADSEIASAIRITRQQLWRHIRTNAAAVLLLVFVLWFFFYAFGIADALLFSERLQKTVTAGVYAGGEKVGDYAGETMDRFAVMTADGTILATDSYLAELMTLYPMTYHLADLGQTRYNDG